MYNTPLHFYDINQQHSIYDELGSIFKHSGKKCGFWSKQERYATKDGNQCSDYNIICLLFPFDNTLAPLSAI